MKAVSRDTAMYESKYSQSAQHASQDNEKDCALHDVATEDLRQASTVCHGTRRNAKSIH